MYRKDYMEECRSVFNDIGLWADADICRLIGYAEDDDDCYYILLFPNRGTIWSSMVGPFVSLKGCYRRYEQLESQMTNLWDCPPEKEFIIVDNV